MSNNVKVLIGILVTLAVVVFFSWLLAKIAYEHGQTLVQDPQYDVIINDDNVVEGSVDAPVQETEQEETSNKEEVEQPETRTQ